MSSISPIDHRCQKSVFWVKYGYATDSNGKTVESRKPVRSLKLVPGKFSDFSFDQKISALDKKLVPSTKN